MKKHLNVRALAGVGILTAVVVVLQLLGSFIRFGPFSISLVLIPIVVGAALYGQWAGAWLGLVFSVVVLFMDSALFLSFNPVGTVVTVLLKGTLAGFLSGVVYNLLKKWSFVFQNTETGKSSWQINFGVLIAAIVCPLVNTGIFVLGCYVFFLPLLQGWAEGYDSVTAFIFLGMIGGNFLFELLFNLILSPTIVQIVKLGKRRK